jgi:glycosyltransferase involved in cell wall biosynthesis
MPEQLRVALLAGTLGQGGAEKQLLYMARALHDAGVEVRVYCLTKGEFYESALQAIGLRPIWVGQFANPLLRLSVFVGMLWRFRPHVIQSAHSYTNLYAGLAGRLLGTLSVGALRSSLLYSRDGNGLWTRWLISTPTALLANSEAAIREVVDNRLVDPQKIYLIPNVIDLPAFDAITGTSDTTLHRADPIVAFVGQLLTVKRLDRFLQALALAHRQVPRLKGVVIGDGAERAAMEALATELEFQSDRLTFLGQRTDVPALLNRASMLLMTSDDEGFPNVILEAMAARLPVIATPAGDAGVIVQNGSTGFVVPFDDIAGMADRIIALAQSPDLRRQLGEAGRHRVERLYSFDGLAYRLLSIYHSIAQRQKYRRALDAIMVVHSGRTR